MLRTAEAMHFTRQEIDWELDFFVLVVWTEPESDF